MRCSVSCRDGSACSALPSWSHAVKAPRAMARDARQVAAQPAGPRRAPRAASPRRSAARTAEDGSCVVVLGGPRRRLEHPARVRVSERPASLRLFVLVELGLLPLAEQLRRVQVRELVDLIRVLNAQEQQVGVGAVVLRGHLDPPGPSGPAGVNVRDAAIQHEVAGVVVLLVQRA